VPQAKYRSGYDFDDVCDLCQQIGTGTLTLAEMRRNPSAYKVPRKTMEGYLKPRASDGVPRWRIMREEQRCTTLPKTGGRTVLGDAVEKKLMLTISDAALMHCPYRYTEVEEMIRRTCVEMECVVAKTGVPYSLQTDVSTLTAAFIRRCAERGVHIIEKGGHKLGLQRHINQHYSSLKAYAIINKALREFQDKYNVKLSLLDVGNWDETGLDLTAFAKMLFLCLERFGNQVVVPCEQSPHYTLVIGFVGAQRMQMLAIMKGTDGQTPSPYHAQLLATDLCVFLAQSSNGWITNPRLLPPCRQPST